MASKQVPETKTDSSDPKLLRSASLHELPMPTKCFRRSMSEFYETFRSKSARKITMEDIIAAKSILENSIKKTPCMRSKMSSQFGMELYLKNEAMQTTGSFKDRGARYTLLKLTKEERKNGVVAASLGNHAIALAYHGYELGIPVTLIMPLITPTMKIKACQNYNANIIMEGYQLAESQMYALQLSKESKLTYVSGYDHPDMVAGAGTMGLEIVEQIPDLDACIIPVGGGGLIAGCAVAIKFLVPTCKIIGVEAEACANYTAAVKSGTPTYTNPNPSLAEGLSIPMVGSNSFATAAKYVDKIVTVREDSIALAILRLVEQEKSIIEGAGAVGLAALLENSCPELQGKKVVLTLCGGNIDTPALGKVLDRGLVADKRLIKFVAVISDKPGGLSDFTTLISSIGITIKDIFHERAWLNGDVFSVKVTIIAETKNKQHTGQLKDLLDRYYESIDWENYF
ncbi:L-threonine dehydratase catabolic TdcB-like [Octopus sinensis]|uniref:L-serine ammonia-lyase n=1 Tax=Octopus sinensis TaxID=2607531 RepID=A0A6P7SM45_9MOLL|nr:L-threonine dehydratase catabolic TdcB-like [Octopus sinensis]XP_036360695.1 L-threonine dehydratase catabolic TdcB-like [Octopus sinensis]